LQRFGFQVYSQTDEDGIIAEIFRRIGTTDRVFVECGVEDGRETNTTYLLAQGWRGFWFEGSGEGVTAIRRTFRREIANGKLTVTHAMLTRENVADLFARVGVPSTFDLLSLDIDLNTPHLWRALTSYRPRVAVVEYNASFPPSVAWEVPYIADAIWEGSNWFGASLATMEQIGTTQDMALVGCDLAGHDAFFVRVDLTGDYFAAPFTAAHHYEPPRYYLTRTHGHPRGWG
jgi:hypothetical protein